MKVRIVVETENSLLGNPLVLAVIAVVVILIGYLIYRQRMTRQ
jgi:hypothetical protein